MVGEGMRRWRGIGGCCEHWSGEKEGKEEGKRGRGKAEKDEELKIQGFFSFSAFCRFSKSSTFPETSLSSDFLSF